MPKHTSTPSKMNLRSGNSKKISPIMSQSNKEFMNVQKNVIENETKNTNFINDIIIRGKTMSDSEFEHFVKVNASESYWRILAERSRIILEDQLQENRQLHELYDELAKENEQLQAKVEQCEYLTNVFNSIMSEHDSGIELNITGEFSESKQEKIFI